MWPDSLYAARVGQWVTETNQYNTSFSSMLFEGGDGLSYVAAVNFIRDKLGLEPVSGSGGCRWSRDYTIGDIVPGGPFSEFPPGQVFLYVDYGLSEPGKLTFYRFVRVEFLFGFPDDIRDSAQYVMYQTDFNPEDFHPPPAPPPSSFTVEMELSAMAEFLGGGPAMLTPPDSYILRGFY